jgi:hypothetical protein
MRGRASQSARSTSERVPVRYASREQRSDNRGGPVEPQRWTDDMWMGMQACNPLSSVVQLGGSGRPNQTMVAPTTPPTTTAAIVESMRMSCMSVF